MGFHLKRFLRRTPPAELRQYFDARCNGLSDHVGWESPTQAQLDTLVNAINALAQRDTILADFEQVGNLCNPIGQRALQSVVAADAHILSLLQSAESDEARGIALLLEDTTLFDHALAAAYADRLRHGRSWSAFSISAPGSTDIGVRDWKALEADIAAVLIRPDGTTGKLKIESFERGSIGEGGAVIGSTLHYAIYLEELPVSDLAFNDKDDEPTRLTRRPVAEVAIWYDPGERTLDVVAAGGRPVRTKIAELFANNVLGVTEKVGPIVTRPFFLDRLKRPLAGDTDPYDGIRSVKVILLRLAPVSAGYGRVTIEVDPSDRMDICARSEQWFGNTDPLRWPEWHITQAKLRVVFHREADRARDKTVTIELRAPNGSNIREQIRQHQIISQKYLARWGLVAAPRV
jgi:hypothetical protein